ncbi:BZ3501_MvSof-1269-A2-R1_Chr10-1g02352 [Microbotryum saponariae]|nr:BZ3501_MvSof-1269-A2-R1_Chr10-1g02352 [Microbotryum saponariae]
MGIDNGAPFLRQSIAKEPRSLVGTATDPARLLPAIDGDKPKVLLIDASTAFRDIWISTAGRKHRGRSFIDIVIARLKVLKEEQSSLQVVVILDNAKWRPKLKEATAKERAERSRIAPDNVDVRFGDFRTKPIYLSSEEVQVLQERLPQPSTPNVNSDQIHVWRVGSGITFVMARTEADTYMCASARRGHIIDVRLDPQSTVLWSGDTDWIYGLPARFCRWRIYEERTPLKLAEELKDVSLDTLVVDESFVAQAGGTRTKRKIFLLVDLLELRQWGTDEALVVAGIVAGGDYLSGGLPGIGLHRTFEKYKFCLSFEFWQAPLETIHEAFKGYLENKSSRTKRVEGIQRARNEMAAIHALVANDTAERFDRLKARKASTTTRNIPLSGFRTPWGAPLPRATPFPPQAPVPPPQKTRPLFSTTSASPPASWLLSPPPPPIPLAPTLAAVTTVVTASGVLAGPATLAAPPLPSAQPPSLAAAKLFLKQPRKKMTTLRSQAWQALGARPDLRKEYLKVVTKVRHCREKLGAQVARVRSPLYRSVMGYHAWRYIDTTRMETGPLLNRSKSKPGGERRLQRPAPPVLDSSSDRDLDVDDHDLGSEDRASGMGGRTLDEEEEEEEEDGDDDDDDDDDDGQEDEFGEDEFGEDEFGEDEYGEAEIGENEVDEGEPKPDPITAPHDDDFQDAGEAEDEGEGGSQEGQGTPAGKEYHAPVRHRGLRASVREILPPLSPDQPGTDNQRWKNTFSSLMRLQTLAQELEFKVLNAVLVDYLNGWTQRDWHEIASNDSALVTRMRAVIHALQPHDSIALSRVSKKPAQLTANVSVDLATMTPAEYGRHVEHFEGAANDDGSLLYNAASGLLVSAVKELRAKGVFLPRYKIDSTYYQNVAERCAKDILGWKDRGDYVLATYARHMFESRDIESALSPLDPDDEFRQPKGRKRLLDCLVTALSEVPFPWRSHRADLEALVAGIAKDQSDPDHEHLRAVMRACLQEACGARDQRMRWAFGRDQATATRLVGGKLSDFGPGGRLKNPIALLPVYHHLLIESGHGRGIVPTEGKRPFVNCSPGYLGTILTYPVSLVRTQLDWLNKLLAASVVNDVSEPAGNVASPTHFPDEKTMHVKPEWARDAVAGVKALQHLCFGRSVAGSDPSTPTVPPELSEERLLEPDAFAAFGPRLVDILFDTDRILDKDEIPAGSLTTNGHRVRLRVLNVSSVASTERNKSWYNNPDVSIGSALDRTVAKARLWLRFQTKGKKGPRVVKHDLEHYVDGIKHVFRLSYARPGSAEKPSRIDELERKLRERAVAAAPIPLDPERQALIEREAVRVEYVSWKRFRDVPIIDSRICIPSIHNPEARRAVLGRLQEHSNKKFGTQHAVATEDLIAVFEQRGDLFRDLWRAFEDSIIISIDLGHARPVTAVARVFTHDETAAFETFRFGKEGLGAIAAEGNRKGARQRANKTHRINEALRANKLEWSPLAAKLGFPLRHTHDAISVSSTRPEATLTVMYRQAEQMAKVFGLECMGEFALVKFLLAIQENRLGCSSWVESADTYAIRHLAAAARRPNHLVSSPPTHPETATYSQLLSKGSRPAFLVVGNGFTSPGPNPSGVSYANSCSKIIFRCLRALGLESIYFCSVSEYLTSKLCWHSDCRDTDGTRNWVGLGQKSNGSTCFRVALGGGTCVHPPADRDIMGAGNCLNAFEHEILWGRHPFFRSSPAAVQASQDQQ